MEAEFNFKDYTCCVCCRELLVIGGVPAKDQLAALEQGVCGKYSWKLLFFLGDKVFPLLKCHTLISFYLPPSPVFYPHQIDIVVGTPGRLDDLISTGKLSLSQVRFLVLDECVRLILCGKTITSTGHRLIALSFCVCSVSCCFQWFIFGARSLFLPSGRPPICRLYRLYQQDPQPNPPGHLWWKEAAGNTKDEFVCSNKQCVFWELQYILLGVNIVCVFRGLRWNRFSSCLWG